MTEAHQERPADYRVRLFLSVDLSGSTAYKNSRNGGARAQNLTAWAEVFGEFYRSFPEIFSTEHSLKCSNLSGCGCPKLWKAIGDELVFVGRVRSKEEIARCVDSFIKSLHVFRKQLRRKGDATAGLDLKGAGWLAAFPEPNIAVRLREDGDGQSLSYLTESLEVAADEDVFAHDFIGKSIDTGFRVSKGAESPKFALSVQLASALLDLDEDKSSSRKIYGGPPRVLKGVNGDVPYPTLYIDTLDGLKLEAVHKRERKLFHTGFVDDPDDLKAYLAEYCHAVSTEDIALPLGHGDATPDVPQSYKDLRERWDAAIKIASDPGKVPAETEPTGETDEISSVQLKPKR